MSSSPRENHGTIQSTAELGFVLQWLRYSLRNRKTNGNLCMEDLTVNEVKGFCDVSEPKRTMNNLGKFSVGERKKIKNNNNFWSTGTNYIGLKKVGT